MMISTNGQKSIVSAVDGTRSILKLLEAASVGAPLVEAEYVEGYLRSALSQIDEIKKHIDRVLRWEA